RRDVIGHRVLPLRRLELYVLRAVPQAQAPEFGQLVEVRRQGDEMVAGELAELAGEMDAAIGEQDLGLADAAGIEDHLARRGVGGMILIPDAELQIAEGYPHAFAAPADVNDLRDERHARLERGAGLGRGGLEPRVERKRPGRYTQFIHCPDRPLSA